MRDHQRIQKLVIGGCKMRSRSNIEIVNHLDQEVERWFAIRTKYKAEKQVVQQLCHRDVEAYIPLVNRKKKYGKKVKTYQIPLIYNYVFVRINKSKYLTVLEQQFVYEFVKQGKHLVSIPEFEIEMLKKIVGDEYGAIMSDRQFIIGDQVEVIAGNLTGLTGRLIASHSKQNMLVELENIGYQFRIEIDTKLLVKKGSPLRA